MQFLLGEKTLDELQGAGAHLPRLPGVPHEPRAARSIPSRSTGDKAARGKVVFAEDLRPLPRDLRTGRRVPQQDRPAGRDRHRSGAVARPLRPPGRPLQLDLARRGAPGEHRDASATRPRRSTASGPPPPTCTTARSRPSTPCSSRRPGPAVHPAAVDRLRALRHGPRRLEVHRGLRRGAGLDGPPLAVPGQVHRRHGRFGMGNGGHTFGDDLSEEQRMDLIEYLKTL